GRIIFGSEVKSLLECSDVPREADPDGILSTLFFLWTPEPKTAFKGIEKLPAGCNMIIEQGDVRIEKYWDLTFEGYGTDKGESHYAEELESLLQDSVRLRMIADVNVGAFLSGGLDSSLITALMTAQSGKPVTTYTIAFTEEDKKFEAMPDDQKYAKIVAKYLGADYREIVIKPDVADLLPKIVWHLDEPIADPAGINTYLICKLAKESGTTVMLSGMGADEIFGGYRKHLSVKFAHLYKKMLPSFLRTGVIEAIAEALPVAGEKGGYKLARWAKRFSKSASLPDFDAFIGNYAYYNETEMRRLLTPEFAARAMPDYKESYPIARHYAVRDAVLQKQPSIDLITLMCAVDTKLFLASLNLMYSDKTSMAAGVEERVPFVDYRIVEFAHRLPPQYKIGGLFGKFEQKKLLKKISEKHLPKEIIYRPKAPFGAPLRAWVRNDLDAMISELLSPSQLKKRGIFNAATVSKMIADHKSGREDSAHRIWALLTLEIWMQKFIDR
ncbi:MAG: asparagine synthetase B, partial [Rhizobacter sp.]|nr:asparagine synthetase B [Chlorobiales bacterium]